MRKILVLLVLVLSASWLLAQDTMSKPSGGAGTTIQGCLSTASEHYYLTDSSGKRYFLSGYANKLKDHVGHTVNITGMLGEKTTDTTQQGVGSTATQMQVFKVKSIQHVADSCKAM
jgi:hypothetical protein